MDNFGIIFSKPFRSAATQFARSLIARLRMTATCSDQHRQEPLCFMQINQTNREERAGKHPAPLTQIFTVDKNVHTG